MSPPLSTVIPQNESSLLWWKRNWISQNALPGGLGVRTSWAEGLLNILLFIKKVPENLVKRHLQVLQVRRSASQRQLILLAGVQQVQFPFRHCMWIISTFISLHTVKMWYASHSGINKARHIHAQLFSGTISAPMFYLLMENLVNTTLQHCHLKKSIIMRTNTVRFCSCDCSKKKKSRQKCNPVQTCFWMRLLRLD